LAYLRGVDAAPFEPVDESLSAAESAEPGDMHSGVPDELWGTSEAKDWGLGRDEFNRSLLVVGMSQNFGLAPGLAASDEQKTAFFRGLKLDDLVLAKACAAGVECAWEHFMALYSQPLTRAAIAISGSDTVGRDLADAFYAELYGLRERDGARRCPLDSYRGRGSLLGWLRTTLAQRFVDHHRRTHREQPLNDLDQFDTQAPDAANVPAPQSPMLAQAVENALQSVNAEERFILSAYFLDERTLAEIAGVLPVHEATVSRRLKRITESIRKGIVRSLLKMGMSRRAAEEALGSDPRDVDLGVDLRKLLQNPEAKAFTEKTVGETQSKEAVSNKTTSDEARAAE